MITFPLTQTVPPPPVVAPALIPVVKLPDDPPLLCPAHLMSVGGSNTVRWVDSWNGHRFFFEYGVLKGALLNTQPGPLPLRSYWSMARCSPVPS